MSCDDLSLSADHRTAPNQCIESVAEAARLMLIVLRLGT